MLFERESLERKEQEVPLAKNFFIWVSVVSQ